LVVEEFLSGEEVSFIGLCDGDSVLPLEPSQDHKTIFEDDLGPNTGGMGAYSDARLLSAADRESIVRTVMQPVLDGMKAEGSPFVGFLYAGLMLTSDGPKVLEFNVRLGDPETQALLHRLDCDFGALVHAAASGRQDPRLLKFRPEPSICVVLAAHGYPGTSPVSKTPPPPVPPFSTPARARANPEPIRTSQASKHPADGSWA
jgi:phosphoribosylamine--glycine ligase